MGAVKVILVPTPRSEMIQLARRLFLHARCFPFPDRDCGRFIESMTRILVEDDLRARLQGRFGRLHPNGARLFIPS